MTLSIESKIDKSSVDRGISKCLAYAARDLASHKAR